jgi:hypothetical protein
MKHSLPLSHAGVDESDHADCIWPSALNSHPHLPCCSHLLHAVRTHDHTCSQILQLIKDTPYELISQSCKHLREKWHYQRKTGPIGYPVRKERCTSSKSVIRESGTSQSSICLLARRSVAPYPCILCKQSSVLWTLACLNLLIHIACNYIWRVFS